MERYHFDCWGYLVDRNNYPIAASRGGLEPRDGETDWDCAKRADRTVTEDEIDYLLPTYEQRQEAVAKLATEFNASLDPSWTPELRRLRQEELRERFSEMVLQRLGFNW